MAVVEGMKGSLKERGIRLTRQRQILLDLIDKSGKHLDAESLYHLARKEDPKLNRVTVYRTLKMLKKGGLVDELDLMHFGGDQHFYETRLKQERNASARSTGMVVTRSPPNTTLSPATRDCSCSFIGQVSPGS